MILQRNLLYTASAWLWPWGRTAVSGQPGWEEKTMETRSAGRPWRWAPHRRPSPF